MFATVVSKPVKMEGVSKRTGKEYKFVKQKVYIHPDPELPKNPALIAQMPTCELNLPTGVEYELGESFPIAFESFYVGQDGRFSLSRLVKG